MKKLFILILSVLLLGLILTGCGDISKITVNPDDELTRCLPCEEANTATGLGNPILSKGNWFMYNKYLVGGWWTQDYYGRDIYDYFVQAGNPKNGLLKCGEYWIRDLHEEDGWEPGWYEACYWIDRTYVVVDEHLAIQDDWRDFTAKPGVDDNADFYEPFYDDDGEFYIFAHFAVECAEEPLY